MIAADDEIRHEFSDEYTDAFIADVDVSVDGT